MEYCYHQLNLYGLRYPIDPIIDAPFAISTSYLAHVIVLKLGGGGPSYFENNQKEHYMVFKTEYASKEDIEKYHLGELKKKYHLANPGLDWTYDKERDVFLMLSANGRGDEINVKCFLLYWKGEILHYTFSMFFEKETKTIIWEMHIYGGEPQYKSEEERKKWEAIHADLRDALRSYGLAGSVAPDNEGYNNARFSNF